MKETPILFSTPMVQAEMSGRKKQTRRTKGLEQFNQDGSWVFEKIVQHDDPKLGLQAYFRPDDTNHLYGARCPYGQVGDVLWVRESYCPNYFDGGGHAYKADWDKTSAEYVPEPRWTPNIHMPKAACRIKLRITNIRVEMLQDISMIDAIKEGVEYDSYLTAYVWYPKKDNHFINSPIESFKSLWKCINGPESWAANPWVWVIEFERIQS